MNDANISSRAAVSQARTPSIIPTGKFQGVAIAAMDTDDLRAELKHFFRRDPVLQGAIMQELSRRRPGRHARRPARTTTFGHRLEQAQA